MINKIFNSQTKTVTGAAGVLAIFALISRVLGVLRDWLLAKTFGAGPELDSYFAAFRVPDMVYNILIAGGVIVSFMPLFSEYFTKNKEESWKFVNNVLNIFLFSLVLFSLILLIFAYPLVKLFTPGFTQEQLLETTFLTRLMLLSPILLGLSAVFSSILQYFNRFLIYSFSPILYNLGIIFGILFLSQNFGILGVSIGVVIGAFLHFIIQVPSAISCGFKFRFAFDLKDKGIKRIFLLMLPRTFAVAGLQINLIVITAIASTLEKGSISIFNFANHLQYFPIGIIGASFAIAVFPSLTRFMANGVKNEFAKSFSSVFRQVIYVILPLSTFLFLLREQIVEIIFRYGKFSQLSAQLTASSLGLFCFGILALSLTPLVSRAFFAFQDTKTPTIVVFLAMILNITLSFYLTAALESENFFQTFIKDSFSLQGVEDIRVLGLSLAFSISAIFQIILLVIFLYLRIRDLRFKEIFSSFLKVVFSTLFMAVGIYFMLQFVSGIFLQILASVLIGLVIYIASTFLLKSPEINSILKRYINGKH